MSPIGVTQSGASAVLTWTSPSNNSAAITAYKILVLNPLTALYTENQTLCDGSSGLVFTCTITMNSLIYTLSYLPGQTIYAVAQAQNEKGWSVQSSQNTDIVLVQTTPQIAPVGLAGTSTISSVALTWTAITGNANSGYATPVAYNVYMNSGSGYSLATTSSTNSASITGLNKGTMYYFKVSGTNLIGEGPLSTNITLTASQVPLQMNAITLSLSGTNVQISFTAPDN